MGGFFGVASKNGCTTDLFYGTDYHSHLGTMRGGLVVINNNGFTRSIHDITNSQFRSKFEDDIVKMNGNLGIGVISDNEDQPLIIGSHLGDYAIVTVGVIKNLDVLKKAAFKKRTTHFSEMSHGEINPTELVATIINEESTFEAGIRKVQELVEGSCSILLLTRHGIYAARDWYGRTPVIIGKKPGAYAVTMETCAFPNLDYDHMKDLGPGEIVLITEDGVEQKAKPDGTLRICSFLWVYYGYPSSTYEGINVEQSRYRCGASLAKRDDVKPDLVAGIPDSGTGHAIGYANAAKIPHERPFVKYTPTWPRSFMPQNQLTRDLVAKMKLIPIREIIKGKKLLFCEDSIVRGTQLRDTIKRLFEAGAKEVHMRPACPPLLHGCKFLNFSRSRSILDLAGRRAVKTLEGDDCKKLEKYADPCSKCHAAMVEIIRKELGLTSLRYQRLDDLTKAIGLPKKNLCTYCWDAEG
ncbi:MAG TPA: amidophosphoribosyltransferase [Lentisphaeria bacterium]|nr:MAG: amidophosphoribosyltransferase [Lentisphaerae bacterium GWF2_49_21]HBC85483.1 amidophosphoribosyltransferase [Lentisphaeria bacterium]